MDEQLLAVINAIYRAALDPQQWPAVLTRVSQVVGADAGTLWIHDFADSSASFELTGANVNAFIGFEPRMINSYAERYSLVNVWTANEERLPSGSVVTSSQLYPDAYLKKTEFYGDWLQRQDLFFALGSVVEKEDTRAVKMSFLRPERHGQYGENALLVMQILMPHLRTAVAIHRRMHAVQGMAQAAFAALDRLNFGVILAGARGEIRHTNVAADNLSMRTRAFAAGPAGYLQAWIPSATHRLLAAVRAASEVGACLSRHASTSVRLRCMDGGELHAHVVPMPASAHQFGASVAAMIFISDPAAVLPSLGRKLQEIYLLSPSESFLAEALIAGKSLKEFAEERGTTMNTVKTQLKSLAAKVGAKRQVDIVRCILTGPGVLDI